MDNKKLFSVVLSVESWNIITNELNLSAESLENSMYSNERRLARSFRNISQFIRKNCKEVTPQ